jgi:hypothetical protein
MYANPVTQIQMARQIQRELMAQADQQRIGRQVRDLARASRSAGLRPRPGTWRAALRPRTSVSA